MVRSHFHALGLDITSHTHTLFLLKSLQETNISMWAGFRKECFLHLHPKQHPREKWGQP